MGEEKLLTIRDAAMLLGVSEKEVMDLADQGAIPAYKIGGVYLRFKRPEVEEFKKKFKPADHAQQAAIGYSVGERLSDFFYFNDFYILAVILIALIIVFIMRG